VMGPALLLRLSKSREETGGLAPREFFDDVVLDMTGVTLDDQPGQFVLDEVPLPL
jgi:hypothetical protein